METRWLYTHDGRRFLVDLPDWERLCRFVWKTHRLYAYATIERIIEGRAIRYETRLHREIIGLYPGDPLISDHIDRNEFNCTRANLRRATPAQSSRNTRPPRTKTTSRYKGVTYCPRNKTYRACMLLDGKVRILGAYKEEKSAALCYDYFARKHHQEFAYLNFPDIVLSEPPPPLTRPKYGPRKSRRFKGVYEHHTVDGKFYWVARYKGTSLGYYEKAEDAARAYDAEARRVGGDEVFLNFPDERGANPPRRFGKAAFGPNRGNKYKGVRPSRAKGRWRATMNVNGKDVNFGSFGSPEEAAKAVDRAALAHHGPGCFLNFPDESPGLTG